MINKIPTLLVASLILITSIFCWSCPLLQQSTDSNYSRTLQPPHILATEIDGPKRLATPYTAPAPLLSRAEIHLANDGFTLFWNPDGALSSDSDWMNNLGRWLPAGSTGHDGVYEYRITQIDASRGYQKNPNRMVTLDEGEEGIKQSEGKWRPLKLGKWLTVAGASDGVIDVRFTLMIRLITDTSKTTYSNWRIWS